MEPQAAAVPPTPPIPPAPQIKNSLLSIMSILLIVTVAIAGLFYFQIQKLSKELSKYQTQPSPTPTATTDPTANWKVFTTSSFSLKYPSDWAEPTTQILSGDTEYVFQPSNLTITVGSGGIYSQTLGRKESYDEIIAGENKNAPSNKDIIVSGIPTKEYINTMGASTTELEVVLNRPNNNVYLISMPFPPETDPSLFDQILSTFKFLGATSSANPASTQKACTLEAKLCPDGSSVGRTGPNCEFAPCP